MFKIFNTLVCLVMLLIAVETRASDNLTLTKYMSASEVPKVLYELGGGVAMVNKSYNDEDGALRKDKVFYGTTHSYISKYKAADIAKILNPSLGQLETLFENTQVKKSSKSNLFDVMMEIATPIKNFDCASVLSYKYSRVGNKNIFIYTFLNFNMVFTDMVIKIEVNESGSNSKINLTQIAVIKGTTYKKLKNFFAIAKFEKSMKENLKKLKDGVGGI